MREPDEPTLQASGRRPREVRRAVPVAPGPGTWILGGALAVALFAVLLAFLPVAPTLAPAPEPEPSRLRAAVALVHVLVIAAGTLLVVGQAGFLGSVREDDLPRSPVARRAWAQTMLGVGLLGAAWTQLYTWLFSLWSGADFLGAWVHGPKGLALADAWNTLGSFAFLFLYLVLDLPSVRSDEDAGRAREFQRSVARVAALSWGVAVLSLVGRHGWLGLERLGPFACSLLAAVAMMYFFGKFDYRYMRVKRLAIAPLYVYVAIQTAWHEIAPTTTGASAGYADALFLVALVLKAYFFGLLALWIRNRTLQRYLDFASL